MQPNINLIDLNSSTTVNPSTIPNSYLEQIPNQIVDQPPEYRYGFFMVDNELIDEHGAEIGPYAFFVYGAICRYSDRNGKCFPSVSTLARVTGISESSVRRSLNRLEEHKLIYRTQCFDPQGGQRSNIYTLLPVDKRVTIEGKGGQSERQTPSVSIIPRGQSERPTPSVCETAKQEQSYKYTLEQETEKNNTNVEKSKARVDAPQVEPVVVVVESSSSPSPLPDVALPEQQECFNHLFNRFTELTNNHQPNPRDTILLQKLSGYAKDIIDNAFDAALERATNPDKPVIRDAAAWLLGTAKRMQEQRGSQVKPRTEEATSEDYRRFNRENGGVILGLSGSVEEGGSVEAAKVEAQIKKQIEKQIEMKAEVEVKAEVVREEPTEEQKETWAQAQRRLKGSINSVTYEMGIEPLILVAVEGNRYTLQAPNQGVIAFLEQNGIGFVKRNFRTCLGDPTAVISFEAAEQPKSRGPARRRFH